MTLVVNLFAGPGSGKSTTAAGIFSLLKMHDVKCEYVQEYAKDIMWEKTLTVYYNQMYILGEQHKRQHRLLDQVDVMVTDSPLLMQCVYVEAKWYQDLCVKLHHDFDNKNYFLGRVKEFEDKGRREDLAAAIKIDIDIKELLRSTGTSYVYLDGDFSAVNQITDEVLQKLGKQLTYYIDRD